MPHFEALVKIALYGVENGSSEGLKEEARVCRKLVMSDTSRAIVHLFFVAQNTSKVLLGAIYKPLRKFFSAGVIGGGLVSAGIATGMLHAGVRTVIKESEECCKCSCLS